MHRRFAWPLGGSPVAAGLRRLRRSPETRTSEDVDPRAEELRRRLDESRAIVEEREQFEAGEPTVAETEHAPEPPELRRQGVHDAGRDLAARMREHAERD